MTMQQLAGKSSGYYYRSYWISPEYIGWGWAHRDYDGPGDYRCGTAGTLREAKRMIDELIEDLKPQAPEV